VGERFGKAGMADRALGLHTYNVDNFPKSEEAMASQLDIVDYYLDDANDPNAAANATERLVSVFSGQDGLAPKVYEIAGRLAKAGRSDDAIGLYEYNVESCGGRMRMGCFLRFKFPILTSKRRTLPGSMLRLISWLRILRGKRG